VERIIKEMRQERMRNEAWAIIDEELADTNSPIRKKISDYLSLAEDMRNTGRLKESKEAYHMVMKLGNSLYKQSEKYVRECKLHEEALDSKASRAALAYSEGKLSESRQAWEEVKRESVPRPLNFEF
jgi:uncharacterized membrane-anchored protein YjiN (DUF445 family)